MIKKIFKIFPDSIYTKTFLLFYYFKGQGRENRVCNNLEKPGGKC